MGGWTVATYLQLAEIIQCAEAAEGTNFETSRLIPILHAKGFEISEVGLQRMLERNPCFGGRGPQKLRGCSLKEGDKCGFVTFITWSRRA